MLFAPLRIGSGRPLVEFGVLIAEHEPDVVGVAVLLTDQKMLLAIFDREPAFRLDVVSAVRFGQTEIRGVFGCPFRPDVCDLILLVADSQTGIFNLARNGIL